MPNSKSGMLPRAVASGASIALLLALSPTHNAAQAAPRFEALPQSQMQVMAASSVEKSGELPNGPAELVLDGDPQTYWHTQWMGSIAPLPHFLSIKIAEQPTSVARVRLTPRQSSNGSGRVHEYSLYASTDNTCADDAYTLVTEGEFDGLVEKAAQERAIELAQPVEATCLKVVYKSSWGGKKGDDLQSPPEQVASLAELNVDRLVAGGEDPATGEPDAVVNVEGVLTISDGNLAVRLHPGFPQVLDYTIGKARIAGKFGAEALTSILINEKTQPVAVGTPSVDATTARYPLTFPELPGISMTAKITVADGVVTYQLTDIVDPDHVVRRVRIPRLDLVSVSSADPAAALATARLSVNRAKSGDRFISLADARPEDEFGSFTSVIHNGSLAAGFETNAIEDNTAGGTTAQRVQTDGMRYLNNILEGASSTVATVGPGTFVVRGSTADLGIGADTDPYVRIKFNADANDDGVVDWQDGAIAARDVIVQAPGGDEVANRVVRRIPFNIVSQATHPFLRTLDDTKRIALATEGLGQWVMLKGYQAEGHDSAQGDYAGHYNERAGGREDLLTLVNEGERFNATFGVHVNSTESYSEAHVFGEDLLRMPPEAAWGWMNQAYYMDGPKDLGTGNNHARFQKFRDDMPANLSFLYMDVYYPNGWEAQRHVEGLVDQGWDMATEWADKYPRYSTWSHWANDENYGGQKNKGVNSQLLRFIDNAHKDIWNPHPILSNANVQEFEGWTGHVNANPFFDMVWQRNLPTKFLQRSDIMRWGDHEIRFANGTVATSPLTSIGGKAIPTDREISFDGATVYTQGRYLLPWEDGGNRLYHYNPAGGSSTWHLTESWAGQQELTMYELTDTGRANEVKVPVKDGSVTLEAKPATAYVLFPSSDVPAAAVPQWGQGTPVNDPGFFSGSLDDHGPSGDVTVVTDHNRNKHVQFGPGKASISQMLHDPKNPQAELPAGTYSAWAWVEIQPGKQRPLTVSVSGPGVAPAAHQAGSAADACEDPSPKPSPSASPSGDPSINPSSKPSSLPTTETTIRPRPGLPSTGLPKTDDNEIPCGIGYAVTKIDSTSAPNATASDEKFGQYYQRVRVTFTTTGGPVTLQVAAGEGDAVVKVDDLRVVDFTPAKDAAPTSSTILFEDFEHTDTGYWPFVTGSTQGGDARTQLAERHEPYSQSGWWGKNAAGAVVEGGKLIDNVIEGDWSLLLHEENQGLVLRTTSASLPLEPGHRYKFSFDAQVGHANTYALVHGVDRPTSQAPGVEELTLERVPLPQAHTTQRIEHEFVADGCYLGSWIGIEKTGGGNQADLTIDNIRVEDLGVADTTPACAQLRVEAAAGAVAGEPFDVTVAVDSAEGTDGTEVQFSLTGPEGWKIEQVSADKTLPAGGEAKATFRVTTTEAVPDGQLVATTTYSIDGRKRQLSGSKDIIGVKKGENFLSDLRSEVVGTPTNGWGPIEWDMSNGEQQAGDGNQPMSIAGKAYPKGIGVHAKSSVTFRMPGECSVFKASVGVDDVQLGRRSTVRFSVLGHDKSVLYGPSEVMRAGDKAKDIEVDIAGQETITLVVDDAGDGNGNDHADWAMARINCQ